MNLVKGTWKISLISVWLYVNVLLWDISFPIGDSRLRLNAILLAPIAFFMLIKLRSKISKLFAYLVLSLFLLFLLSLGAARFGVCEDGHFKGLVTAVVLFLMLFVAINIGVFSKLESWELLPHYVKVAFTVSAIFMLLEAAIPLQFNQIKAILTGAGVNMGDEAYYLEFRYSGLFAEPSHMAITLCPCLFVLWASFDRRNQFIGWGMFALSVLISRNSTCFAFVALWGIYSAIVSGKLRKFGTYSLVIGIVILILSTFAYQSIVEPLGSRVVGIFDTESRNSNSASLSSLVYVQGWEDAMENFTRTNGVGLGINMMGCTPLPVVPVRLSLAQFKMEQLNAIDGSFMASKLISEFGLLGILLVLGLLAWGIYFASQVRWFSCHRYMKIASSISAIYFATTFSMLIRSSVYFQGTALLIVPMIVVMWRLVASNNRKLVLNEE